MREEQRYVYVVSVGELAAYRVLGIFSTMKLARAARLRHIDMWNRNADEMRRLWQKRGVGGGIMNPPDDERPRIQRWPVDPQFAKEVEPWAVAS